MTNRVLEKSCRCAYSIDIFEDFTEAEVEAANNAHQAAVDVEVQKAVALNLADGIDIDLPVDENTPRSVVVKIILGRRRLREARKSIQRPEYRRLLHPRLDIRPNDRVTTKVNADTIEFTFRGQTHIRPIPSHAESQRGMS